MVAPLLIFAIGNPSRGDDALGPLLVERLAHLSWFENVRSEVELQVDFQLQIEHALDMRQRRMVLFLDAAVSPEAGLQLYRESPDSQRLYSTHGLTPGALLDIYAQVEASPAPPCFVLAMGGERFELGEGLSAVAAENLVRAEALLEGLCQHLSIAAWQERLLSPLPSSGSGGGG